MTVKKRIALFISLLFTLLFGLISFFIVGMFSDFRKQEFRELLEEKALSTMKLLLEVKEVDIQMLKIIDRASIHKLFDEKTLVFNNQYELIYSSLDDTRINWTLSDLEYLKQHKTFFKKDGDKEIYGVFYDTNNVDYYALISANDTSGKRKLEFLIYLIAGAYVLFTILAWFLTSYTIKKLLMPLDDLHKNISEINEHSLANRIPVEKNTKNEIDLIGLEFNLMMNRIEDAYQKQKDFTSQASHELRTPLARITAQLENELNTAGATEKQYLNAIMQNVNQIGELINSLLILSKVEARKSGFETARVDEAIYSSIEKVHAEHPDYKVNFEMQDSDGLEELLTVKCNQNLLEIVFSNLLSNAYRYSDNKQSSIIVKLDEGYLCVEISNNGPVLTDPDQQKLFQPFARGSNTRNKPGLGLGLRIVHRILSVYGFKIRYSAGTGLNTFIIHFQRKP